MRGCGLRGAGHLAATERVLARNTERGRSMTASMMLKMAVSAPIPIARDSTAMAAKPGLRRSVRRP